MVCGASYYVDKRALKILSLPPHLSRRGIHLTGIATHRKDRSVSGVKAFLTFNLSRPAVVMICYDSRLHHVPVWLLYFRKTPHKVQTTEVYPFSLRFIIYVYAQVLYKMRILSSYQD